MDFTEPDNDPLNVSIIALLIMYIRFKRSKGKLDSKIKQRTKGRAMIEDKIRLVMV